MNTTIIAITQGLEDNRELTDILERLNQSYTLEVFPVEHNAISFTSLPVLVDMVKSKYEHTERVVVLSNIREYVLGWFRCFNGLINEYIYIIDPSLEGRVSDPVIHNPLVRKLYNFDHIRAEHLTGTIYVNMHSRNYSYVINFMARNRNYTYFSRWEHFQESNHYPGNKNNKVYILDHEEYVFDVQGNESIEEINFDDERKRYTLYENEDAKTLLKSFILPYVVVDLFKNKKSKQATSLMYLLSNEEPSVKSYVFDEMYRLMTIQSFTFVEKIRLYSLLVLLRVPSPRLAEDIVGLMLHDHDHLYAHHNILAQLLLFSNNENLIKHESFEKDKKELMLKIINAYKDEMHIDLSRLSRERHANRIVILTDQLLGLNHSPTKVTLEYADYMTRMNPDSEVTIIVEDNFIARDDEILCIHHYRSALSKSAKSIHDDYIKEKPITIIYSEPSDTKVKRTEFIINTIIDINPRVVFSYCEMSLAQEYVYELFPTVYLSFGTVIPTCSADVYLFKDKKETLAMNEKVRLLPPDKVKQFTGAISIPEKFKTIHRNDLGFTDQDFIIVTVGNRLDAEIDDELIDMMESLFAVSKHIKWLIVGPRKIQGIDRLLRSDSKQVNCISYESDLSALYEICDVFLNPIRHGGGYSVVIAMAAGLPIVISDMPSDALVYVGEENASGSTVDEMREDVIRLYMDKDYRKDKSEKMVERLAHFTVDTLLDEFRSYFAEAEDSFKARSALTF